MKYIRTKYGIWLFGGTHHKGDVIIGKKQEIDFGYCFDKKDIINQANTIEELCDEFVDTSELKTSSTSTGGWLYDEFDSKNKCLVYYAEDERRTISLNEFDDLSKIFGAIWTDKGLIYVAKMNEKGCLELL